MTSSTSTERPTLSDLASALEEKAVRAVIPGELARWCRGVREPLRERRREIAAAFDHEITTLGRIGKQDPELLPRTEELEARLMEARRSLGDLDERLEALCREAEPDPGSSAEPTRPGEQLREEILSWIVGARALDQEILTWYQESVNRDRGEVD